MLRIARSREARRFASRGRTDEREAGICRCAYSHRRTVRRGRALGAFDDCALIGGTSGSKLDPTRERGRMGGETESQQSHERERTHRRSMAKVPPQSDAAAAPTMPASSCRGSRRGLGAEVAQPQPGLGRCLELRRRRSRCDQWNHGKQPPPDSRRLLQHRACAG